MCDIKFISCGKFRDSVLGRGHFCLLAAVVPIKSPVQTVPSVLLGLGRPQHETHLSFESTSKLCVWSFTATDPYASATNLFSCSSAQYVRI